MSISYSLLRTSLYSILRNTLVYFMMYVMIVLLSTLLLSIDGFDLATTLSAQLTCFNNVGPGIGLVGPMHNFAKFSGFSKVLLSLNMLLGRLEIYPMLVLFSYRVWKRNVN